MRRAVLVLSVIAGIIALWQGVAALQLVGNEFPYTTRLWAAYLATACGPISIALGWLALRRPGLAAAGLLVVMPVGTVSINLFYINTFYVLATPLWLLACVIAAGSAFRAPADPMA